MKAQDVTDTLDLALAASGCDQARIVHARRHRGHQAIVVHPVKKFGQVNIHDEPIAFDDVGLRLRHRLVSGAARPEAVAVLAECRVPQRLTEAEIAVFEAWFGELFDELFGDD
jgi:hypothetical protein